MQTRNLALVTLSVVASVAFAGCTVDADIDWGHDHDDHDHSIRIGATGHDHDDHDHHHHSHWSDAHTDDGTTDTS